MSLPSGWYRCKCGEVRRGENLQRCLACESYATIAQAHKSGASLTADGFREVAGKAGRIHGPGLIWRAHTLKVIDQPTLTAVIGEVWSNAEFPEESIGHARWLELFKVAGFTVDGKPCDKPNVPGIRLYRASDPSGRRRISWTDDIDVARKFISYRPWAEQIFETIAPPSALLAVVHENRAESEFLLDTRGLRITPAADANGYPAWLGY